MTGQSLWTAFLAASAPDAELAAFGEDIGYKRSTPSPQGYQALVKIAKACSDQGCPVLQSQLFGALKQEMPGMFSRRSLLEGLAAEYSRRLSWPALRPATRDYLARVGRTVDGLKALHDASRTATQSIAREPLVLAVGLKLTAQEASALDGILRKVIEGEPVSDRELAIARNLSARAGKDDVVKTFDKIIETRRLTDAPSNASVMLDRPSRLWPLLVAVGGVVASYLFMSHKRRARTA